MHVFNLNYRGSIPSEHFRSSMWLDLDGTDDLELESHFQRNPKEYRMMTVCLNYIKYAQGTECTERMDYKHFIDEVGTWGRLLVDALRL